MHRSSRRFAKAANLLTMTHVGTTVRFRKKILTSQRRAKVGAPAIHPTLANCGQMWATQSYYGTLNYPALASARTGHPANYPTSA
jgi:hypothetical protein